MPARIVRRSFATPFVVTLAAACSSSPPPSHPPIMNPPAPQDPTPTDPTPPANPPTDPQTPPTTGGIPPMNPPAPQPVQRGPWRVFKTKDGCQAVVQVECPRPEPGKAVPTCNPPPAHKYEPCPEGVTEKNSLTIVSWVADNCRLQVPMPSCPPKVHCNPPPPKSVPCPE